jgi:hypothetical protein
MKENEMGWSCSTYRRHEECIKKFKSEILKGRDHPGDRNLGGRMLLKCILKKQFMRMWIGLFWLRRGLNLRLSLPCTYGLLFIHQYDTTGQGIVIHTDCKFCMRQQEIRGRKVRKINAAYEGVFKSFRTKSVTKYTLTFGITR